MSISILNRGASGGLKPELTVTAPSGSALDLLQNGIIVDTYTLGASETEHTFVVKVGTYTVRGTLDGQSKSVDVVIDAVGRYSINIQYKYWVVKDGVIQNNQTATVTHNNYSSYYSGYVTYNPLVVGRNGASTTVAAIPVDFTNYETLCVTLSNYTANYSEYAHFNVYASSTSNLASGVELILKPFTSLSLNTIMSADITNILDESYVAIMAMSNTVGTYMSVTIGDLWLE